MYLIRELTPHSFPEIGAFFSGRDHSTVIYAVNKVQTHLDQGEPIARDVQSLKETLI